MDRLLGHEQPYTRIAYGHVSGRDVQAAAERIGKTIEVAMEAGKTTAMVSIRK